MSTWDFALGTAVGLAPGTLAMSYVGWNLKQYTMAGATNGEVGMDAWETRRLWSVVALTIGPGRPSPPGSIRLSSSRRRPRSARGCATRGVGAARGKARKGAGETVTPRVK